MPVSVTSSGGRLGAVPRPWMRVDGRRRVLPARRRHDVGSARGEHLCDASPDAAGRTGDDHDLLTQIEHAAMTASS